jgi:Ig-like domain from next to BRCA1 gene
MSKRSRHGGIATAGHTGQSNSKAKDRRLQIIIALITGLFAVIAAVVGAYVAGVFNSNNPPEPSSASSPTGPLMSGDASLFVRDVTFPDYSKVHTNERFTKIWELKDDGTVKWAGRYLAALGPSSGGCKYPSRVRIPATDPGRTVDIRVNVTAPASPGMCFVTWKMVTRSGSLYFPNDTEGIWFKVKVIAKAPN